MLAALLLNRIGNAAGRIKTVDEEKAQRALEQLRDEHFERERKARIRADVQVDGNVYALPREVFKIDRIQIPAETARVGDSVDAEELALLLIIAEL